MYLPFGLEMTLLHNTLDVVMSAMGVLMTPVSLSDFPLPSVFCDGGPIFEVGNRNNSPVGDVASSVLWDVVKWDKEDGVCDFFLSS